MSDIVIKAENIGKMYTIGHQAKSGRYVSLRDVLMQNARNLWNKTKDLAKGTPIIKGDTMEEIWALKDVSFEIRRGEAVGIIGRNGAGKSTLLKILSRITAPSTGRVAVKGRIASLLEVGTGFHPELSGRENIFLNGAILGMTRAEIKEKFDAIVDFAETERFLDTPVKRYSSGMYVRLAFAVAAHLEPEILIVDEVLAVGDALFQKKCLGKMTNITSAGRTVLFVSHNMTAVRSMCSRVLTLDKGQLAGDETPPESIRRYLSEMRHGVYVRDWTSDSGAPRNGGSVLRRASIVDDAGVPLEDLYTDSSFNVDVEFEVLRESTSVGLTLILYDADHNCVFSSINNLEQTWYGKAMATGVYKSRCSIPANLLNNGLFFINLNFFGKGFSDVVAVKEVLTFEIIDGHALRGDYHGGFGGIIRPRLDWKTEQLSHFVSGVPQ